MAKKAKPGRVAMQDLMGLVNKKAEMLHTI
jgi:hypothetical protein